jgi:hypothetical protein
MLKYHGSIEGIVEHIETLSRNEEKDKERSMNSAIASEMFGSLQ